MQKVENREILNDLRDASRQRMEQSKCRILICAGTGCLAGGSAAVYEKMCELVAGDPDVEVHFGPEIAHGDGPMEVKKSGCHGFCEMGPLMRIEPMGILYTKVKLEDCEAIFERTIKNGDVIRHLLYKQNGIEYQKQEEIPFYKKQTRLVLEAIAKAEAFEITEDEINDEINQTRQGV